MQKFSSGVSQITPNLWLCGMRQITEGNLRELEITHILNTAEELEDFRYPNIDGLNVKHIVFEDSEDENLLEYLNECVDYIFGVIKSGGNILIHCIGGVSRSASVCIAYMVKYEKLTLRKAYFHVLHRRHGISPNLGFWGQLVIYEEKLRGDNSVEMLPFFSGTVPNLYTGDAEYSIKFCWMKQLLKYWFIHLTILLVQIISIIFQEPYT